MTREEITGALASKGIGYNKFWKTDKLEALLPKEPAADATAYTDERIAAIGRELSGAGKPPIEVALKMTTREGGEAATKSGIVVPGSVLAAYRPTKWQYGIDRGHETARVFRTSPSGYNETVREYSKAVHGDGFLALASAFVAKNS